MYYNTKRFFLTLIIFISIIAIISSSCSKKVTEAIDSAPILISDAQEVRLGAQVDSSIRYEEYPGKVYDKSNPGPIGNTVTTYIDGLGQAIVQVSDRKTITYHFAVIDTSLVNAFAAPGGYIYVTTGLMKQCKDENELAAVIGHEVGHVVARHGAKTLQAYYGTQALIGFFLGDGFAAQVVSFARNMILSTGYSQAHEYEADNLAVDHTYRLGLNPYGVVTFFETLQTLYGNAPSWLNIVSSHPPTDKRIENAKNRIESNYSDYKSKPNSRSGVNYSSIIGTLP